jgi:hypothetical protein
MASAAPFVPSVPRISKAASDRIIKRCFEKKKKQLLKKKWSFWRRLQSLLSVPIARAAELRDNPVHAK